MKDLSALRRIPVAGCVVDKEQAAEDARIRELYRIDEDWIIARCSFTMPDGYVFRKSIPIYTKGSLDDMHKLAGRLMTSLMRLACWKYENPEYMAMCKELDDGVDSSYTGYQS